MGQRKERNKNVVVILASYNGEKYITQQIDSILSQSYKNLHLFIRDDGSEDGTVDILRSYSRLPNVTVIEGDNLGVVGSIFECLLNIGDSYDYVALSDQDDIWHADKIERAVAMLDQEGCGEPLLYYSERNYCNEDLSCSAASHLNRRGNSFQVSLFDNVCSGNTLVFNRELLGLLKLSRISDIYSHDWWIGLVASCLGKIIYDECPTLEYRRLDDSVSSSGKTGFALFKHRIKSLFLSGDLQRIARQNRTLIDIYGKMMSADDLALASVLLSEMRMKKAFFPGRLRQTMGGEILLRLCFLTGVL